MGKSSKIEVRAGDVVTLKAQVYAAASEGRIGRGPWVIVPVGSRATVLSVCDKGEGRINTALLSVNNRVTRVNVTLVQKCLDFVAQA